jgi:hypothetical protein
MRRNVNGAMVDIHEGKKQLLPEIMVNWTTRSALQLKQDFSPFRGNVRD